MADNLAIKCIRQPCSTEALFPLMYTFRCMVNDCIRIGLENNISTMKQLSKLAYKHLANYDIISYYKLCAISHAAGILANRKKSIKRGFKPRQPYAKRPLLISCYGFKITDGVLKIPIGGKQYFDMLLNIYVRRTLSNTALTVHSFTLTCDTLSIAFSKEVDTIDCTGTVGVDRNLHNLTIGNSVQAIQYDLSKTVDIAENTCSITRSFKRNDVRIRKKLYAKYGRRRKNRINQLLHHISKVVVQKAKEDKTAIAFEKLTYIRRLYQKGNYQGKSYRYKLNGWSFSAIKRQIEYKSLWEGVPIIQLSKQDTRSTSQLCPRCGKKITQVDRKTRQLWCAECKKWMDRDVVAAMNISIKGLARFASSKGLAGEAMVQELVSKETVILKVDASKLTFRREPQVSRTS